MGKVMSTVLRPFRDFNIESRALKAISREKREPAPRYEKDKIDQERMLSEFANEYKDSLKKNEVLNDNLRNVFVTSFDPPPQAPVDSSSAKRPLPLDTTAVLESDFGFREPKNVPYGKVTLRSALELIQHRFGEPETYPISKLAVDFKLSEESVEKLTTYLRVHELYVPDKKLSKAHFIGPKVPRIKIIVNKPKNLPSGETKSLPMGDKKEDT